MIRVVIGDDHAVFREAVQAALEQHGFRVPATAASVSATLAQLRFHQPDICLLDRHFPGHEAIDTVPAMRAASPGTAVLVLTADHEPTGARRALGHGASGYLHKTRGVRALVAAIHRVHGGKALVDVPMGRSCSDATETGQARMLASHLTARERECLAMLVDGCDTAAMSAELGVSSTTVRTHVQAVLTKLGVHSRLEAASFAVRHRLLDERQAVRVATAL